jgi:hypothetical protein
MSDNACFRQPCGIPRPVLECPGYNLRYNLSIMPARTRQWHLGFPYDLIADGEYAAIEVGQTVDTFALEFWCERRLKVAATKVKSAVPLPDYRYRVTAEIKYLSATAAVIDFGIQAVRYANLLPSNVNVGDFVRGDIYVGVPICIQMIPDEILKSLRYKWRVDGITADMTPYIEKRGLIPGSQSYLIRDKSRMRYEEVVSTKAMGAPVYVLHCTKLD